MRAPAAGQGRASCMTKMKWFFFYDSNFKPLRDNMVASARDDFDVQEDFLEDLGVMKMRAGGGIPTYLYKSQKIKESLESCEEGELCLFTDVDVQFLAPTEAIILESASGRDLVLQREFDDIGVNIGVCALRNTAASRALWRHVHEEIVRTQALDQRVVNNALYSGLAEREFGLVWGRFPPQIWASSMAFSGLPPADVALHHANFTLDRAPSADPSLKLSQMAMVAAFAKGGDPGAVEEFVAAARTNQSMLDYRDRHFGPRRPGPEWAALAEGHPARPGGFSEKQAKKKAAAAAAASAAAAESAEPAGPAASDAADAAAASAGPAA